MSGAASGRASWGLQEVMGSAARTEIQPLAEHKLDYYHYYCLGKFWLGIFISFTERINKAHGLRKPSRY